MAARPPGPLQSTPRLGYVPELDGLRAIAILSVLVTHFNLGKLPGLTWAPWGEIGVRIFFVLSGYLITGILLSCREIRRHDRSQTLPSIRVFYVRRFLRIFPIYYGLLILMYVVGVPGVSDRMGWHLSYTTNFLISFKQPQIFPVGHLWSLSVEEQFYLVWPWLIVFSSERGLRRTILGVIALGPLSRFVAIALGQSHIAETHLTTSCLDTLGLGALLAACSQADDASRRLRRRLIRIARIAGPTLLIVSLSLDDLGLGRRAAWVTIDLGIALSTVWLIDHVVRTRHGLVCAALAWSPMVAIGKISYGLYLYHRIVQWALPIAMAKLGLMQFAHQPLILVLWTGISLGIAQLSWTLFESPIQRLKRRFSYSALE